MSPIVSECTRITRAAALPFQISQISVVLFFCSIVRRAMQRPYYSDWGGSAERIRSFLVFRIASLPFSYHASANPDQLFVFGEDVYGSRLLPTSTVW